VSNTKNEFDEELQRAFKEINELRQQVEALQTELSAHEKRELLRVRGNLYCRVCLASSPIPPISEAEQKYHDASHASGTRADLSRRLAEHPATVDWDQLERQLAETKKTRREGW
jgi:hypothetical protein